MTFVTETRLLMSPQGCDYWFIFLIVIVIVLLLQVVVCMLCASRKMLIYSYSLWLFLTAKNQATRSGMIK
jgi:hypothetical protein